METIDFTEFIRILDLYGRIEIQKFQEFSKLCSPNMQAQKWFCKSSSGDYIGSKNAFRWYWFYKTGLFFKDVKISEVRRELAKAKIPAYSL